LCCSWIEEKVEWQGGDASSGGGDERATPASEAPGGNAPKKDET